MYVLDIDTMPELMEREKKEFVSFPGLLQRASKEEVAKPSEQEAKPEQSEAPKKKTGRPRKDAVVGDTPRKKGIDPKNSKVF